MQNSITTLNKALLDSTIQDLNQRSQILHMKFKYNIGQLTNKNAQLSEILKVVSQREKNLIIEDADNAQKIIKACLNLRDSFLNLDILQKKSELLKSQSQRILKQLEQQIQAQNVKNNPKTQ